ncbi:hypothetical protein AQUSIP_13250 [Aquicella siphonis]|uniref:Uncharacterized protein n=1 Tax=Aquicella siphonis TaxID=254247 RepID=A0A5E4PGM3_9COXI|nr:hypothetical protein [Aquicella siphonis]VVC76024.1 hypothetical protein AQUSIP_13250 [Aquicella siphonis]
MVPLAKLKPLVLAIIVLSIIFAYILLMNSIFHAVINKHEKRIVDLEIESAAVSQQVAQLAATVEQNSEDGAAMCAQFKDSVFNTFEFMDKDIQKLNNKVTALEKQAVSKK